MDKWRRSPIENKKEHEEAKLELEAVKKLSMLTRGFINAGNVACTQLKELEKKRTLK